MDEKEILRAKMRATPRTVFRSLHFATALAVLIAARVLWTNQQAGKPLGAGLVFAGIMSFAIVSSALSLLTRNKFGYLFVLIAGVLPLLGSFALSLHALRLVTVGSPPDERIGLVTSVIGLLQFVTIVALLVSLLRRETRNYVWKSVSAEVPIT